MKTQLSCIACSYMEHTFWSQNCQGCHEGEKTSSWLWRLHIGQEEGTGIQDGGAAWAERFKDRIWLFQPTGRITKLSWSPLRYWNDRIRGEGQGQGKVIEVYEYHWPFHEMPMLPKLKSPNLMLKLLFFMASSFFFPAVHHSPKNSHWLRTLAHTSFLFQGLTLPWWLLCQCKGLWSLHLQKLSLPLHFPNACEL